MRNAKWKTTTPASHAYINIYLLAIGAHTYTHRMPCKITTTTMKYYIAYFDLVRRVFLFFTNSFKISCALLCFDCLLVVVLVLVLVLSLDLNECGAKSTEICANNQNRANSRIYICLYIVVSFAAMRISSLSPLSIELIHKTISTCALTSICTDNTNTHLCMYTIHTHTLFYKRCSFALSPISAYWMNARVFLFVFVMIMKTSYGISVLHTILYYTILYYTENICLCI